MGDQTSQNRGPKTKTCKPTANGANTKTDLVSLDSRVFFWPLNLNLRDFCNKGTQAIIRHVGFICDEIHSFILNSALQYKVK